MMAIGKIKKIEERREATGFNAQELCKSETFEFEVFYDSCFLLIYFAV